MAKETEIKLPVGDIKAFERKVKKLGGKSVRTGNARVHELNVIFDTPDGGLAKHGQLLRIRTESVQGGSKKEIPRRIMLTFKQPAVRAVDGDGSRFKIREETEVEVADAALLGKIFEGLGLRGWFRMKNTGRPGSWARQRVGRRIC